MKKLSIFALIATLFAGCSSDTTTDIIPNLDTLKVGFVAESRVQLFQNCQTVWNSGDKVSVFYKDKANSCWEYQGEDKAASGEIVRLDTPSSTSGLDDIVAIYPYSSSYSIPRSTIEVNIPAVQHYTPGSYGIGDNIMVAVADSSGKLSFKNIFGWVKLSLTGKDSVTKIVLRSRGTEGSVPLTGTTYIDWKTLEATALEATDEECFTLTLDCGSGVALSESQPTDFYIGLLPTTFTEGFYVVVYGQNDRPMYKYTTEPVTITRNHITPTKSFSYTDNGEIRNNEIWYTTTDGKAIELQNLDFGANVVSNTYNSGKGIITFDGEVTNIGYQAFSLCQTLASITLPHSLKSIETMAFYSCSELQEVVIPDSVLSLGSSAFIGCTALKSVTLGEGVKTLPDSVFAGCSALTEFNFNTTLESISSLVFNYCTSLETITIPDSVTEIGSSAFSNCSSLKNVHIGKSVKSIGIGAFSPCDALTNITIPDSVTTLGDAVFQNCQSLISVEGCNSVTDIGYQAFENCISLESFTIPSGVETIKFSTFSMCSSLRYIIIPDNVKTIESFAFTLCENLEYATIADSVTSLGRDAFNGCTMLSSVRLSNKLETIEMNTFAGCSSLPYIELPTSVTTISHGAFANTSLNELTLHEGITTIGEHAFWNTQIMRLEIPNSVTSLGSAAFYGCPVLGSVTIGEGVTEIAPSTFEECNKLYEVTLGKKTTSIGSRAFKRTYIHNIDLPNTLQSIGNEAFGATFINTLTIPSSVTEIGAYAFNPCDLTRIYCQGENPPTAVLMEDGFWQAFFDQFAAVSLKIYVPASALTAYMNADGWKEYASSIFAN